MKYISSYLWIFASLFLLSQVLEKALCFDCHETLKDTDIKYMDWSSLEECLLELGGHIVAQNTSENIWRLVKISFDGLENIPPDAYKKLGVALTAIPDNELRNISMERVEIVEAFGAVRKSAIKANSMTGGSKEATAATFNEQQMRIIAQKVRHEWLGKMPKTYSEYDLMSMGQIICYLNITDIAEIHPDAFKYAAEWIGNLQGCPQQSLQAFAELATREDAFGPPSRWSKIDLSIIGNIVNGLSQSDIESIDERKLYLNRYYVKSNRTVAGTPHRVRPAVSQTPKINESEV